MSLRDNNDESIIDRNKKIDDMRKQLESKLMAMAGESESEFDRLRKQVADLRTSGSMESCQKSMNRSSTSTSSSFSSGNLGRNESSNSIIVGTTGGDSTRKIVIPEDSNASTTKFGSERSLLTPTSNSSKRRSDTSKSRSTTFRRDEPPLPKNKFTLKEDQKDEDDDDDEDEDENDGETETETDEDTMYVAEKKIVDPYGDSGSFTGELSRASKKPNGFGKMRYKDRRIYEGGWKHGQWHGKGTASFVSQTTNQSPKTLRPTNSAQPIFFMSTGKR